MVSSLKHGTVEWLLLVRYFIKTTLLLLLLLFLFSYLDTDMRQPSSGGDGSTSGDNSSGANNLDPNTADIPSHLPPKQRELFIRIKQHQHENSVQDGSIKDDLEQGE